MPTARLLPTKTGGGSGWLGMLGLGCCWATSFRKGSGEVPARATAAFAPWARWCMHHAGASKLPGRDPLVEQGPEEARRVTER